MSQKTTKENQLPLILISLLTLAMAVGGMAYLRYGHQVIQAVYEGRAPLFLNSLIEGQNAFPLELYLQTGDGMFFTFIGASAITIGLLLLFRFNHPLGVRLQWVIAAAFIFLIVSIQYFRPILGENESVYLIGPQKWLHPGLLAHDLVWQDRQYSHFLFEILLSPFYLFLSPLGLALGGRLVVWGLLIWALIRLAKTIGLGGWELVLAFFFWFYAEQSLAAGDWAFGGIEAKALSYFFLVMALRSLLNEKIFKGAIYAGLAVSFHTLVGGWGALALWITTLFDSRQGVLKKAVFFPLLTLLFALPGILPSVYNFLRKGSMAWEDYEIHVFFRSPHHLDPRSFLSLEKAVEGFLYYLLTLIVLEKSLKREQARTVSIFLTSLIAFFASGLVARERYLLPFLFAEPCRVGPLFLLLLFFIVAVHFLKVHLKSDRPLLRGLAVLILGILAFDFFRYEMPEKLLKQAGAFVVTWKDKARGRLEDDFADMSRWIQTHTEEDSTFIAPPWEDRFWLLAERAQVVSYKYVLHSHLIKEWKSRLIELNGGKPFQGKRIWDELKENYPFLTREELLSLKEKYKAAYYLTTRERRDLAFPLLYSNNTYYLYNLKIV